MVVSENNNITKADAYSFMSRVNGRGKSYVIEALINCTLYGKEYPSEKRYGNLEMSYFSRAFNITEYGASKQKNRIKGRYKKYVQVAGIEEYYRSILNKNWPAFPSENPRMDDILKQYANAGTASQNVRTVPQNISQKTQNAGPQNMRREASDGFSEMNFDSNSISQKIGKIAPAIVVLLIIILVVKFFKLPDLGIREMWNSFVDKVIHIVSYAIALFALVVPVIVFFKYRSWRNKGALIAGIILYMISYSCMMSHVKYSVILSILFWAGGVISWTATDGKK